MTDAKALIRQPRLPRQAGAERVIRRRFFSSGGMAPAVAPAAIMTHKTKLYLFLSLPLPLSPSFSIDCCPACRGSNQKKQRDPLQPTSHRCSRTCSSCFCVNRETDDSRARWSETPPTLPLFIPCTSLGRLPLYYPSPGVPGSEGWIPSAHAWFAVVYWNHGA
jgi:hypothetical protein